MKNLLKLIMALALLGFTTSPLLASDSIDGKKLFSKKCKMCHSVSKNKTGPALIAMNQGESVLRNVITNGSSKKKMMKAYGKKFSPEQIDALVGYIRSVQ
jgi:mono/diheme cytochrome c family protein